VNIRTNHMSVLRGEETHQLLSDALLAARTPSIPLSNLYLSTYRVVHYRALETDSPGRERFPKSAQRKDEPGVALETEK
jgi:hypothetical protein